MAARRKEVRAPGTTSRPVRRAVRAAIEAAHPCGVVELHLQPEDSWLSDVWDDLRAELDRIGGAKIMHERPVIEWRFEPAREAEHFGHLADDGRSASYRELFLGLTAPDCQYDDEIEIVDGGGNRRRLSARGVIGCTTAVSLLAPFALVEPDRQEHLPDGSMWEPSIETCAFDEDGGPMDRWEVVRSAAGESGVRRTEALRKRVVGVLDGLGIALLPDDETRQPAGDLRAGDGVLVGQECTGRPISVRDALFFWSF